MKNCWAPLVSRIPNFKNSNFFNHDKSETNSNFCIVLIHNVSVTEASVISDWASLVSMEGRQFIKKIPNFYVIIFVYEMNLEFGMNMG